MFDICCQAVFDICCHAVFDVCFLQAVFDCPFGYQLTGGKASLWCTPTGTWSVKHIKHA